MLVESFARGGAERQVLMLSEGLLSRGYEVRVFELIGVVPGQSSFEGELAQLGIPLSNKGGFPAAAEEPPIGSALAGLARFGSLLPGNLDALCRALALAITHFQPSVVHAWSDTANLIGGFVANAMGVQRIILGQRVLPPPFWFGEAEHPELQETFSIRSRCEPERGPRRTRPSHR